jgi:hypothetical protein
MEAKSVGWVSPLMAIRLAPSGVRPANSLAPRFRRTGVNLLKVA